jgi:hypothetical protein
MARFKLSPLCALLIGSLGLFEASPARAEDNVTVDYFKSGMTIMGGMTLSGSAHSDNAPITNVFVSIGGAKVAEQSFNSQSVSFDFYAKTQLHGELTLFVTAQDASGATFSSETFTNYFPSELSLRLLTPVTNVTVTLGQGIPISADADIDIGQVRGLSFSMDNGNDYSKSYFTPSPTRFTWYPQNVGTYNVSVRPVLDITGPVQGGFFTL